MTTEIETALIDNAVSNEQWPWPSYIGQSKLQKVILLILSRRQCWQSDVWRGALSIKSITRLLFKKKRLTPSQRASFSRSIKRLENDGLINRERGTSDAGYTTHIGLTQRGYYQAMFNEEWYKGQLGELLTFFGLNPDKYHIKVNKKQYNQKRSGDD